jgi:hypothetical protein
VIWWEGKGGCGGGKTVVNGDSGRERMNKLGVDSEM